MKTSKRTERMVDGAVDACKQVGFSSAEWALLALVAASEAKLPNRELRALGDALTKVIEGREQPASSKAKR